MRTLSIILALYSLNAIAEVTFESAAESARKVPLPAFESVVTQSTLNATLPPASFGDTTPLSSLRGDKGMGDLATPGFNKSVACDTQNDPECLAIQMVKRGSANRPKLDEKTTEKLIHNHTEIMTQSPTLLGDLADLSHTEKTCEKIEQVIPGVSTTEVCDITLGTTASESTCEEGWEESRSPWVSYVCTMSALSSQNACTVTTLPVTHEEHVFACTDRAAVIDQKSCVVPATVTVNKTYPYGCLITKAAETKKTCVKTLNVIVTPLCSTKDPATTSINLRDYRTLYGWRPNSAYYTLSAVQECRASLETLSIAIKNGGTTVATVTSLPATINANLKGLDVVIRLWEVEYNHQPSLMMDVTNVDTGKGATTLTVASPMPLEKDTQTEYDVWSESCDGASTSTNETCTVTSRTCLQGAANQTINGYVVTRDCWQWQEERTCSSGESIDQCAALAAEKGCSFEKETCLSMNASGVCDKTERVFACDHDVTGLPAENVALDIRATVEATFDKQSACATYLNDIRCTETGHVCSATGATRPIDGIDVTLACWEETYSFACETSPESLACSLLGSAGCTFEKTIEKTPQTTTNQYACLTTSVPTHTDITYLETVTVTDAFETDDSDCEPYIANSLCTLEAAICEKNLNDVVCGTETRTYSCPSALDTDACKLLKTEACSINDHTCTKRENDVCLSATEKYTCKTQLPLPLPASIQETARGERIDAITPTSTCPTFTNARAVRAGACTEIGRVCTEGASTKIVDGHPVTKDCWSWSVSYRCEGSGETTNGCTTWETDPNCTLVTNECLAQEGDQCTYATRTYRCEESADRIVETEKCTESVCAYGFCETRDEPGNTELLNAVLKLEVARQAAVYGEYDEVAFFTGEANTCRNKAGGVSCCAGEVKGDMSNQSGLGAMYVFAADTMSEAVKTLGSPYVYDVLASHESMVPLLNTLYGEAASGAYSPSLSYYGITVSYGANGMVFEFNPYVFFAMVAVEVATDYLSCDPDEQALQLKRGQNLCVYLGSRCSQYSLGHCLIKEESHCCYNSRLARIVQEAAHKQLNKSWGTLTAPDCSGLTAYEFMTLDFTQIDLTDFLSDIARQPLAKPDADRTLAQTEARIDALRSQPNKYPAPNAHTDVCANGACGETP